MFKYSIFIQAQLQQVKVLCKKQGRKKPNQSLFSYKIPQNLIFNLSMYVEYWEKMNKKIVTRIQHEKENKYNKNIKK